MFSKRQFPSALYKKPLKLAGHRFEAYLNTAHIALLIDL